MRIFNRCNRDQNNTQLILRTVDIQQNCDSLERQKSVALGKSLQIMNSLCVTKRRKKNTENVFAS